MVLSQVSSPRLLVFALISAFAQLGFGLFCVLGRVGMDQRVSLGILAAITLGALILISRARLPALLAVPLTILMVGVLLVAAVRSNPYGVSEQIASADGEIAHERKGPAQSGAPSDVASGGSNDEAAGKVHLSPADKAAESWARQLNAQFSDIGSDIAGNDRVTGSVVASPKSEGAMLTIRWSVGQYRDRAACSAVTVRAYEGKPVQTMVGTLFEQALRRSAQAGRPTCP